MRVGIMSMQRIVNYGSYMQALSLKQMIESLGHEVQFVDYVIEPTIYQDSAWSVKGRTKRWIKKTKSSLRNSEIVWLMVNAVKHRPYSFRPDPHEYISLSENQRVFLNSLEELGVDLYSTNYHPKLDVLVIGSDEVFNCLQTNKDVGFSMELFGKNNRAKRLISYAASFGDTTLERLQQYGVGRQIRKGLRKFDAVSVRDRNSYEVVAALSSQNSIQHLDPVLVGTLESQEWKGNNLKNYIAVYAYSNRIRADEGNAICEFGKDKNLEVISIVSNQRFCKRIPFCPPDEIIPYFKNASYVVTDTFHGVIFSVITHKPFVVFVREPKDESYSNSQKLIDLLEKLGLEDRWAHTPDQIVEIMEKPIDYERIDAIRVKERERTMKYLTENIC